MRDKIIRLLGGYTAEEFKADAVKHRMITHKLRGQRDRYRQALGQIAECETPKANATVRRMASIARQAWYAVLFADSNGVGINTCTPAAKMQLTGGYGVANIGIMSPRVEQYAEGVDAK